ncbi:class I SAM-dependent methyltransferase [Streptomyces sp. NPDC042319]|uniref:SAM-dependent methyltransferase n=1 Tax=Streptomyces sp. NPDC042319 TaxID=3154332 RepID=UPI0034093B77
MMQHDTPVAGADDFAEKNRIYDTAAGALWRMAVYEPVHEGLEFTNMAGAPLLDLVATTYGTGEDTHVLDLCSGTGEVCRYLATRHGHTVTGIELNSAQLRHAVRRQRDLSPDVQRRIRIHQGDVTVWHPDRLYDLVLAVDSLTLLAEPERALETAFDALVPGGHLILADIVAGATLTQRVREQVWDYDGIRPLPQAPATEALLTGAGFRDPTGTDISDAAITCFQKIRQALRRRSREIKSVCEPAEYELWLTSTDFYLRSFSQGELTYWRYAAEHPRR